MIYEDKTSREVGTGGDESLILKVIEYSNSEGKTRALNVESKDESRGMVYESGVVQVRQTSLTLNKNQKVRLTSRYVPKALRSYYKAELKGKGSIVTHATRNIISLKEANAKIGLIIERGYFLACETESIVKGKPRGFKVQTSWNLNLEGGINSYRDMTTTVIKGSGYYVLEVPFPLNDLVEITVLPNTTIELNEDSVVMRTIGVKRKEIDEDRKGLYNTYSGVYGKGVIYEGDVKGGKIWIYPGQAVKDTTTDESYVRSFIPPKVEEPIEEKERGILGLGVGVNRK